MNLAAKEIAQLEQPGFDRSIITKIAIFNLIEARQQFIADYQNQFTGLFIKFLCRNRDIFHCFSKFIHSFFWAFVGQPIAIWAIQIFDIPIKTLPDILRCAVKNGVYCFKQRVDLHSIAAKIVLATDSPIFSAYAAGYKRFQYIR